jgi:hypothetical protein
MKKPGNSKKGPKKSSENKAKDSGELRKPSKLIPLKEKNKKNWKSSLDDEEDDFAMEDDIKLDDNFEEGDEDDDFYDDDF